MGPGAWAWDREGGGEILDHRGVRCWLLAVSGPGWRGDVYLCFDPMFVRLPGLGTPWDQATLCMVPWTHSETVPSSSWL